MSKLDENIIELSFIKQLIEQGYTYHYGPDIAPNSDNAQRDAFDSVILESRLKDAIKRLNPSVPESARVEAYQRILNLGTSDLMENNEYFQKMLTDGVKVEYNKNGDDLGVDVRIFDVKDISNNEFWLVNQFVVRNTDINGERGAEKRLDVVLFVNGLPLVVVELKNAVDEKASLEKAYTQIQNYKKAIPKLFYYNSICIISDGIDARTSSLSAPFSRFLPWKAPKEACLSINDKLRAQVNGLELTELQTLTKYMLDQEVLLKLIRYCIVFEKEKQKDKKTGIVSQIKVKKVGAYHQYYAVQKAVEQTIRATDEKVGDRKVGVVWHTQGSGKSLSMVFYCSQIASNLEMKNPTLVILTDRNDLDEQLYSTFGNCIDLLGQTPVQAKNRDHLKHLLKTTGGGIYFTTIQKYSPEEGNIFDTLSTRSNIVVIADEAHRSQYGFKAKVSDDGKSVTYGNAKYLRDALPNASYIGFTGTPIEKEDKSTPHVFGDYIDVYDIKQAVDDGATVPISYESRLVKIRLEESAEKSIDLAIEEIDEVSEEQVEYSKKRVAGINAVVGHSDRITDVAKDLVYHFEERQKGLDGKAMIVCMTRKICVDVYDEIIALRPDWHNDDIDKGVIKVVMTSSSDDEACFQPHSTTKGERKNLSLRMKDVDDELKLVIVRDMWLTGFDAPCLNTMYVDKKMQGANLMQAIARVNRVYKDKPGGLIVDYIGIGQDLRNAMGVYLQSGGEGDVFVDIREAISKMEEKFEIVENMFHGFDYKLFFSANTDVKLQVLLGAQNHILSDKKLKDRFLNEINTLSKLFSMSIPSVQADAIKDDIAFFQAVKARINKFKSRVGKSDIEVETAIKQIVNDVLFSDGVIDVFEAAGIKAPSVSILSDEFLLEVKNMTQKNLAFELLKKLLNDEVRVRKTKNIEQGRKFSEMLESVVKKYHNNQIDSAQVIHELSVIARDMHLEDLKAGELGLSEAEYAFYCVLSTSDSTKMLDDVKMKELIHAIVRAVRANASVDWSKRDDVRAKLRLTVKKLLIRYGYPPDLARLEADRVLAQGESLAAEFARS